MRQVETQKGSQELTHQQHQEYRSDHCLFARTDEGSADGRYPDSCQEASEVAPVVNFINCRGPTGGEEKDEQQEEHEEAEEGAPEGLPDQFQS